MGKRSSSKKVARAAVTGGGRTRRGARPWGWYTAMVLVSILGVVTIFYSRNERQVRLNPVKSEKPRPPDRDKGFPGDHWHAVYGFFLCDSFLPPIADERDPQGIHTHADEDGRGDGVIHIHPFGRAASGPRATFGAFAQATRIKLDKESFQLPGGKRHRDGDRCNGKKAVMQVFLNGEERLGDPKDIRLRDRDVIVVALAPEGTEIPKPPWERNLDNLSDVVGSPGATTSTTQAPNPEGTPPPEAPAPGAEGPAPEPGATAEPPPPTPGEPTTSGP